MKKYSGLLATLIVSFGLLVGGVTEVEAKRFGGGGSFGGKSSYSSPFRRSSSKSTSRSASQQKAYQQNQAARQSMGRRGGLMGMLGGLALGGLLGSLFFGGAFEGFNFMDILIFGGVAYLLFKIFAAKSGTQRQSAYNSGYYREQTDPYAQQQTKQQSAGFDTDVMFKKSPTSGFSELQDDQDDADFEDNVTPTGFDKEDFLQGAKGAYKDLQSAWDNRDLAEIRALTTDKVFAEIQAQLSVSNEINQTDVLSVDADLLSVREIGSDLEAVVLFDCILREDTNSQAGQVREVWHFIKPTNSLQPKWYLDGIQQLEQ